MGEADGFTSTFVVEHLVIHGGGDTREKVPTTPAIEPSTPEAMPSTPGVVPSSPAVVMTTPRLEPSTPAEVPTTPGVVMSGPGVVPSTPGAVPTTPAEQGIPSTSIKFASPSSDITEFVYAFHDGEEVRLHRLDDIVSSTRSSGLTGRLLKDLELLLVNAEEPPTFALAERDANWRRTMLEEMKAIEKTRLGSSSIHLQDVVRSA